MASITLKSIKKIFPHASKRKFRRKKVNVGGNGANLQITDEGVVAVQNFDLTIEDKEFLVLVGPSGCGKSTTLRMIAGLEDITEGELYIDGELMNQVAPKDRDIAMVFQNYALYPHMSVYENMAFALRLQKLPKEIIDEKVREAADILDISSYLTRKPKALSGGQRQRVAIGRAIVRHPRVFLMDEPLSNLDAKLRNQMRAEIIKLREKVDTTFVYVTHDQVEAMTLGDRVVVMKDGYIQQIGTPQEVFDYPENLFVAGFIGSPQMNFFEGRLKRDLQGYYLDVWGVRIEMTPEMKERLDAQEQKEGLVTIGIRPEHIGVSSGDSGAHLQGYVDVAEMMGSTVHLHVNVGDNKLVVIAPTDDLGNRQSFSSKSDIAMKLNPARIHLFDQNSSKNLITARKKS